MGKGSAFGKTILIGDSFVNNEIPAVVASIPFTTDAIVTRSEGCGWLLEDKRTEVPGYKKKKREMHIASIKKILDVMNVDTEENPIKIELGGDLLAGSGVGASAASCVSLARALNEEFSLGYSIEDINDVGWQGEFPYHGKPSGVDNTASTYGGILLYYIKDGKKNFERIKTKQNIDIVLANSGITADTRELGRIVQEEKEKNPQLFQERLEQVKEQVLSLRDNLEKDNLEEVGKIMTQNHKILIDMGISHSVLIEMCDIAIQNGALGAKLTGGGMGGYISALTPGKQLQERVALTFEKQGYKVIRATIGYRE